VYTSSNLFAMLPTETMAIDSGTVRLELEPPSGVTVYVNEVPSSYLDLADPGFLAFEYFQQMHAVLQAFKPAPEPVRALHLGAAGCSLARAWDFERPGSRQVAVDIDGKLVDFARQWFGLPAAPALRIRAQSADDAVSTAKAGFYDCIVRDVFSGSITPPALTTSEFAQQVYQALAPNGLYLANCADKNSLKTARKELRTLKEVFPSVAAIGEVGVISGKRFGNIVLAASSCETELFNSPSLERALRSLPVPAKIVSEL